MNLVESWKLFWGIVVPMIRAMKYQYKARRWEKVVEIKDLGLCLLQNSPNSSESRLGTSDL